MHKGKHHPLYGRIAHARCPALSAHSSALSGTDCDPEAGADAYASRGDNPHSAYYANPDFFRLASNDTLFLPPRLERYTHDIAALPHHAADYGMVVRLRGLPSSSCATTATTSSSSPTAIIVWPIPSRSETWWKTSPTIATGREDCWYDKTYTFPCKPSATGKAAKSEFVIGDMLDAYFKDFMLFNKALTDEAIRKLASGEAFGRIVSVHPT